MIVNICKEWLSSVSSHWYSTEVQPSTFHTSYPVLSSLQRMAALTGKIITWEKIEVPRRMTSHLQQRHCGPDPPTTYSNPVTSSAQDNGHTRSAEPANQKAQTMNTTLTLPLGLQSHLKNHNIDDLSTCSDLESGVADLSSRSSTGGDDGKDPDSDEAVFTTAWLQQWEPCRLAGWWKRKSLLL